MGFARESDAIALVGSFTHSLPGSELWKLQGRLGDSLPPLDLAAHGAALRVVREAVRSGLVSSAHDVSDGGLACALAECCIAGGIGAQIAYHPEHGGPELLFGEGPGGVVVSGAPEAIADLGEMAGEVGFAMIGHVTGERLEIAAGAARLDVPVVDLRTAWDRAIPHLLS
jgi:phosphoribosylformylglycinamidine synthase